MSLQLETDSIDTKDKEKQCQTGHCLSLGKFGMYKNDGYVLINVQPVHVPKTEKLPGSWQRMKFKSGCTKI